MHYEIIIVSLPVQCLYMAPAPGYCPVSEAENCGPQVE